MRNFFSPPAVPDPNNRLSRLLAGELSEQEVADLHDEARQDPFLREALEGLDAFPPGADPNAFVNKLRAQVRHRVAREARHSRKNKALIIPETRQIWVYASAAVAAAMLLLVAVIFYPGLFPAQPEAKSSSMVAQETPTAGPLVAPPATYPPPAESYPPLAEAASEPISAPKGKNHPTEAPEPAPSPPRVAAPAPAIDPPPVLSREETLANQAPATPGAEFSRPLQAPAAGSLPARQSLPDHPAREGQVAAAQPAPQRAFDAYLGSEGYARLASPINDAHNPKPNAKPGQASDSPGPSANLIFEQGLRAMQENRPAEALKLFQTLVRNERGPLREEAQWLSFLAYDELQQRKEARKTLESVRKEQGFYAPKADSVLRARMSDK